MHRSITRSLVTHALAALLTGTAVSAKPASPPAAADETVTLDPFVAIGTRFTQRTVVESAVPIDVIGRREIRQGGYTETAKVLQTHVPSFNNPHPTTPDGNTHVRSATLRGLSPDQTLVLINGKRRHTSAWVNTGGTIGRGSVSTELNAIPTSGIGHIEVLRDGASAQYGSDAIAGVVNLVLRRDLGSGGSATYGATKEGDGDVWEASLESGLALPLGGFVHTTLYFRERNATNRALPDTRQFFFGTNLTTGALTPNSGAFGSGLSAPAGVRLDTREATVNRAVWRYGDADVVEHSVFVNAELPLVADKRLVAYAFGGIGRSNAFSNASFRRPADNNNVRAIYPNGFLPFIGTLSDNSSLVVGLRGTTRSWDWDVSQSVGGNTLKYSSSNTLNATYGTASPTSFYNGRLDFAQAVTNADAKTLLQTGLSAPLKLAIGGELRLDRYRVSPGQEAAYRDGGVRILDGPSAGSVATVGAQGFGAIQPGDRVRSDRHAYSLYIEAEQDVSPRLRLSAALRHENFSDFGTTLNGKFAGRLAIAGGLAIRASASTGFHAPALQQRYFGSTSSRTDPNTNTIILARLFPVGDPAARALGATSLEPEESTSLTGGLAFERGRLTATIDLYQIEIGDRLLLSSQFIGTAVRSYLSSVGIVGVEGARFFTNAADTRTRGLDLTARYRRTIDRVGSVTLTAGYNRNATSLTRVRPTL